MPVLGHGRQHRGFVLGVVEGDEHLRVLFFGATDPGCDPRQRVAVQNGVIRGDVARDPRMKLPPQGAAEHLGLLVADADEVGAGGVRARRGGARARARRAAGERQAQRRDGDE